MVKVRWTGAAGIEFITDQGVFLIDPYLSRLGKFQTFFKHVQPETSVIDKFLDLLPSKIAGIVAGHTHLDHALDIPYIANHSICKPDCKIIGSTSLDTLFKIHGFAHRVTLCNGPKEIKFDDDIAISMIPSVHGKVVFGRIPFPGEINSKELLPMKGRKYRHGMVFIPKIKIGGTTFMHIGSADYVESELDGHTCDILFMCVPGWKRREGYSDRLIDIVNPKIIVPFHFDDFSRAIPETGKAPILPFQGMSDFIGQIKQHKPKVKIIFPRINSPLERDLL